MAKVTDEVIDRLVHVEVYTRDHEGFVTEEEIHIGRDLDEYEYYTWYLQDEGYGEFVKYISGDSSLTEMEIRDTKARVERVIIKISDRMVREKAHDIYRVADNMGVDVTDEDMENIQSRLREYEYSEHGGYIEEVVEQYYNDKRNMGRYY